MLSLYILEFPVNVRAFVKGLSNISSFYCLQCLGCIAILCEYE